MKRLLILSIFASSFSASAQTSIEKLLLIKINRFRLENGVDTAEYSERLSKASRHHAKWMSRTGILSHDETVEVSGQKRLEKVVDRMIEYGCFENDFKGSNENAAFSVGMKTREQIAEQIFSLWKNSKDHRENMLARVNPSRSKFIKNIIGLAVVKVVGEEGDALNEWAAIMNMGVTFR
jgi:uncharacterized protein YkwD